MDFPIPSKLVNAVLNAKKIEKNQTSSLVNIKIELLQTMSRTFHYSRLMIFREQTKKKNQNQKRVIQNIPHVQF